MKKYIYLLLTIFGICLTPTSQAVSYQFNSFFSANYSGPSGFPFKNSDFVSLQVTNNFNGTQTPTTNLYIGIGVTNTNFTASGLSLGRTNDNFYTVANGLPSFITQAQPLIVYSTNYVNGYTNAATIGGTGATNLTAVGPNIENYNPFAYSLLGTNLTLLEATSGTTNIGGNQPQFAGFIPVLNTSDANGDINTNMQFIISACGDAPTCTNLAIVWFARTFDGNVYDSISYTNITVQLHGTNLITGVLQPSQAFVAGVRSFAVAGVYAGTNTASTNVFITKLGVGMYQP